MPLTQNKVKAFFFETKQQGTMFLILYMQGLPTDPILYLTLLLQRDACNVSDKYTSVES